METPSDLTFLEKAITAAQQSEQPAIPEGQKPEIVEYFHRFFRLKTEIEQELFSKECLELLETVQGTAELINVQDNGTEENEKTLPADVVAKIKNSWELYNTSVSGIIQRKMDQIQNLAKDCPEVLQNNHEFNGMIKFFRHDINTVLTQFINLFFINHLNEPACKTTDSGEIIIKTQVLLDIKKTLEHMSEIHKFFLYPYRLIIHYFTRLLAEAASSSSPSEHPVAEVVRPVSYLTAARFFPMAFSVIENPTEPKPNKNFIGIEFPHNLPEIRFIGDEFAAVALNLIKNAARFIQYRYERDAAQKNPKSNKILYPSDFLTFAHKKETNGSQTERQEGQQIFFIKIKFEIVEGDLIFSVEDNGPGLNSDILLQKLGDKIKKIADGDLSKDTISSIKFVLADNPNLSKRVLMWVNRNAPQEITEVTFGEIWNLVYEERFKQEQTGKVSGSSGLGLFAIHEILKRQKCSIKVFNNYGGGVTFQVTIAKELLVFPKSS